MRHARARGRSTAGHYALIPLLHEPGEWALSRLLTLGYFCGLLKLLRLRLRSATIGVRWWELAYVSGFVLLELFCSAVHPLLFRQRMPFMPLMMTSVYSAIGVLYASALASWYWWRCASGC